MPDWITTSEAARRLSVTPATVRAMCERGELRFIRLGGRAYRVLASSIGALRASSCVLSERERANRVALASARLGFPPPDEPDHPAPVHMSGQF